MQFQRQVFFHQHADHAQRVAAQGEGVTVASRQVANAEHADQGFQLVSQRHHHACIATGQFVTGKAGLVVVFNGVGHGYIQTVIQRVVAPHDALQLGEFAHHVGHQVGLGQLGGQVSLCHQLCIAQLLCNGLGNGTHALYTLALRAQLVVIDHLSQAFDTAFQRLFAVLVKEELGISQTGAHHALVTADHGRRIGRADVADDEELVGQLAVGVQQGKVLLVGLHGQNQALLRHSQEFFFKFADQHIGALDQSGHFIQQGFIFNGAHAAANAFSRSLQLAHDVSTALGKAGDHCAFFTQLFGIAVCALDHYGLCLGFKAVAMGGVACSQAQCLHANQHLRAMHDDQAVGRAHKVDAGPAILQLVAHDLGDGQLGNGFVQCLLHAIGQHHPLDGGCVVQRFGLAFTLALQACNGRFVGTQCCQLLEQCGGGLAFRIQAYGHRHQLLRHGLVFGLGQHFGDVCRQAAGRGIGRHT